MACVGCIDNIMLSSTIGRNKNLITGDVIKTIIHATTDIVTELAKNDITIHLSGGETADVGDIVRTIDVGYTAFGRIKRSDLIINDIQAGDVIVGLASYGQATYETEYNGGMGSNGLTSARHDVLHHDYATQYPDSYDKNTPKSVIYVGSKRLTDEVIIGKVTTDVGRLILSPTRTYLPVLKVLLTELKNQINGLIHCTGGAQTKVMKFVDDNVHIIKDNLLPTPPLFEMIQAESGTEWKEMYQVFNMGHRLEVYLKPENAAKVVEISKSFGIDAQIIGRVEASPTGRKLTIESPYGTFNY